VGAPHVQPHGGAAPVDAVICSEHHHAENRRAQSHASRCFGWLANSALGGKLSADIRKSMLVFWPLAALFQLVLCRRFTSINAGHAVPGLDNPCEQQPIFGVENTALS